MIYINIYIYILVERFTTVFFIEAVFFGSCFFNVSILLKLNFLLVVIDLRSLCALKEDESPSTFQLYLDDMYIPTHGWSVICVIIIVMVSLWQFLIHKTIILIHPQSCGTVVASFLKQVE